MLPAGRPSGARAFAVRGRTSISEMAKAKNMPLAMGMAMGMLPLGPMHVAI